MMKLEGRCWKDGKFWLIEVADLDIMTQGMTKKEAFCMIQDAIESLVNKPDFHLTISKGKGESFIVASADTKGLISLMLHRLRIKQGLTLRQVADNMGARSITSYAQYEQGKSEPSLSKLSQLLQAIDPNTPGLGTLLKVA